MESLKQLFLAILALELLTILVFIMLGAGKHIYRDSERGVSSQSEQILFIMKQ
jgi:hypothetical protein